MQRTWRLGLYRDVIGHRVYALGIILSMEDIYIYIYIRKLYEGGLHSVTCSLNPNPFAGLGSWPQLLGFDLVLRTSRGRHAGLRCFGLRGSFGI